jgi:hypothetical protein
MEIEYARQLHKRIIPVLHAEYDREACLVSITKRLAIRDQEATRLIWGIRQPHDVFDANDSDLKHINYFFFKADANFQTRFDDLFAVIRTDYEHKEQHTTLELRALEWERRGHDASFLLIDNELEGAQTWLEAAQGKEPAPTELHLAYIEASKKRTQQLRNIRRASVVGTIVAVVAVGLALSAYVLGTNAINDAQATLTEVGQLVQAGEARVRSLDLASKASEWLNAQSSNAEITALLAIRAIKYEAYTSQADVALREALPRLFTHHSFEGHTDAVVSVAFSPDGKDALTGSGDTTARLWNVDSGDLVHSFEGHTGEVYSVAFSPDGKYALTGSADTTARLWNVDSGDLVHSFEGHTGEVNSVAFSPDEQYALTGSYDHTARLWTVDSGDLVHSFEGHTGEVYSVAFSPDGQ